ncbi:MAG TPA: hypothetical protein VF953_11545, partial [Terriglobales bacterium]
HWKPGMNRYRPMRECETVAVACGTAGQSRKTPIPTSTCQRNDMFPSMRRIQGFDGAYLLRRVAGD